LEFFLYIDPFAIDENTSLTYITDDIRLCTIQRAIPEQPLGIVLHYHRHECFHYVKLTDDYESTLAFPSGIKSFDRVIECNGINIEDDSSENFKKKIDGIGTQLFQLLVCNPATYAHYKKNNKHLHSKLDTVKCFKSVQDTASKYAKVK
jgi:C-terminal processing protease CtpA/Prc